MRQNFLTYAMDVTSGISPKRKKIGQSVDNVRVNASLFQLCLKSCSSGIPAQSAKSQRILDNIELIH
jgi:hypothetical protein